jgi:hypothetical protein
VRGRVPSGATEPGVVVDVEPSGPTVAGVVDVELTTDVGDTSTVVVVVRGLKLNVVDVVDVLVVDVLVLVHVLVLVEVDVEVEVEVDELVDVAVSGTFSQAQNWFDVMRIRLPRQFAKKCATNGPCHGTPFNVTNRC